MATTITIEAQLVPAFRDAVAVAVRPADAVRAFTDADPKLGSLTWTVDLTAPQLATANDIRQGLRSPLADWAAVRADIQTIRDLRQLGRNAFMALPDAERFRRLYDAQSATTTILLAILRE